MRAVIMAGGKGVRLRPYTEVLPKPMLPLGERPILAWLLDRLAAAGVTEVTLAVHYLDYVFRVFFGDGQDWGLNIRYHHEPEPLGTAGALRTFCSATEPLLVTNADIVTNLDFADLMRFHQQSGAWLTIATQLHTTRSPMGVLETSGNAVIAYHEKPAREERIGLGIYVVDPRALAHVPETGACDMPDLIRALLTAGLPVLYYDANCFWCDLGTPGDYHAVAAQWPELEERLGIRTP